LRGGELILVVENAARTSGAADTVATSAFATFFQCMNSIPSRVRITLDVRDTDLTRRDAVMQRSSVIA